MIYQQRNINPLYLFIVFAIAIVALFYIAKGIFNVLAFIAPFLIIVAFILDRKVVIDYGKNIINQLKTNTLMGIVMVALTIFGFPFVSAYLLGKVLLKREVKKRFGGAIPGMEGQTQSKTRSSKDDGFTEYEEVVEEDDFLELPELEYSKNKKSSQNSSDSEYEQLFD